MLNLGNLYILSYLEIDDYSKGGPEHSKACHRYLRLLEDEFGAPGPRRSSV
ncbi:hypothetical protein G7085_11235 [Tessaracoccus sp. HDW20]|uniref:hypothetical protein n=1 Tax=Tessaracoccus coleopterorum TaxID=2714950 RepID=UPI0018D459D8|nr:hypothetical protein [Tessaracoccus coleopterorum]NHB84994.1 hypothetical protein [Tessaracoccus coleopterorum]